MNFPRSDPPGRTVRFPQVSAPGVEEQRVKVIVDFTGSESEYGDVAEVLAGVGDGERVILDPGEQISHGIPVERRSVDRYGLPAQARRQESASRATTRFVRRWSSTR